MDGSRQVLKAYDFRSNISQEKYIKYNFNKRKYISNLMVKLGCHITPRVTRHKYGGPYSSKQRRYRRMQIIKYKEDIERCKSSNINWMLK